MTGGWGGGWGRGWNFATGTLWEETGHGSCWTPYNAQDSPSQQRILQPNMPTVPRMRNPVKNGSRGTSRVAYWMGVCLPMQKTQVQTLVQEDPTCLRATKPTTTELPCPRICAPQQLKPPQGGALTLQWRVAPNSLQLEEAQEKQWRPACVQLPQSCPTLCNPTDCSLPGSSVHGILQARIPDWIVISSSRGSSSPSDQTQVSYVSCTGRWVLDH